MSGMQPSLDGAVLLLTAALEQFVSDVILAFATDLPNIVPNYGDLPESIRAANERQTGEALSDRRTRFTHYELRRFVDNLRTCHVGDVPYALNGETLAVNYRNLTPEQLRELISRLGVGNIWTQIESTTALLEWSGLEKAESARQLAQSQLDHLIETRNQIAHRVGSTNPGPTTIRSFARFEQALAQSLVMGLTNFADSRWPQQSRH